MERGEWTDLNSDTDNRTIEQNEKKSSCALMQTVKRAPAGRRAGNEIPSRVNDGNGPSLHRSGPIVILVQEIVENPRMQLGMRSQVQRTRKRRRYGGGGSWTEMVVKRWRRQVVIETTEKTKTVTQAVEKRYDDRAKKSKVQDCAYG